ncbi:hypothetical protein [Paenibacillus eucommiae]|uniref:Uncharacterized protein n=1 Tax=Paenibacillus eucommiae TaxID=1355755 RepID=A0ABS4ITJ5_9BACL|nr:hypothetical protein [Paenibacillus eucommiae]MBP1990445.1 hypothetical protein [Paenibacillus eucommiae]
MISDFERLMDEAYGLPAGESKLAVLEEAARIADALGNMEQGYEARTEIVETAIFNGFPLKALVAFSWQLGQYDKNPENDSFDSSSLLWSYKWILSKSTCFPDITRNQIEELLEDFRKRYRKHGYSDRTYYYYRFRIAMDTGYLDEAASHYAVFSATDRDYMSDCEACEQNQIVRYMVLLGEDEHALKMAAPILSGKMSCAEVPHVTLSKVLLPLHHLGREEEAKNSQRKGYRLIKGNRDFLVNVAEHIAYLSLTSPLKGLELLEKHMAEALDHEDPLDQMLFHLQAAALLKQLAAQSAEKAQKAGAAASRLRLPARHPLQGEEVDFSRLAVHYGKLAAAAAERFDRRNGNQYYFKQVQAAGIGG